MTFPFMTTTAPAAQTAAVPGDQAMTNVMQAASSAGVTGLMGLEAANAFAQDATALGVAWLERCAQSRSPMDLMQAHMTLAGDYVELCQRMSQEIAADVALLGAPSDRDFEKTVDGAA